MSAPWLQRVQLHCRLGPAKRCPIEQAQTQLDGGGIECVHRRVQIDLQRFFGIEIPRTNDQVHGRIVIDAPVRVVQRIRECRAGRCVREARVKQLGAIGLQAKLDIAQGLSPSQRREGHHTKQIGAVQGTHTCVVGVALNDASEGLPWHLLHHLRKQRLARVHASPQVVQTRKHRKYSI